MNFMLNSSSSSSSSFHHRTTTPPPNNHHHRTGGTPPSDDAGEDNNVGDLMMPLITRSSSEAENNSTADTNSAVIPGSLVEKEHMFDKAVTPSDVGKLNRLVIPKQHAEKYFPLDSSANEKGLLLNFEDPNGKPWRFRYSYWNSSQSYVMTKGWSRFVKEKKLDAGDIITFKRGLGESGKDRLFIDWRRRPGAPEQLVQPSFPLHRHQFSFNHRSINPWTTCTSNPMLLQPHQHHHYSGGNASTSPYGYSNHTHTAVINGNPCPPGSVLYLRSGAGYGSGSHGSQRFSGTMQLQRSVNEQREQMVFDSVPVVQGKAAAKRLRLFGVNMDCSIPESDECDRGLSSSNHTMPMLHDFVGFDHYSSSSSVPSLQLRPYNNDYEDGGDDDKGDGTSMSLDLDI